MTTLDTKAVQKIADLARLSVPAETLSHLTHDLENILNLVAKMDSVDTSNVKPLAHPVDTVQPMRADEVTEENQRDLFQKNAPSVEAGLYIVPKFVESE